VPISAILIGGRRPSTIPLVHESYSWQHGVFLGSIMGSEITAAAISAKIGQVRRDPFAMLPFIGYNVCDYLQHWLDIGEATDADKLPKIFYVNWFRKDSNGKWLWPGFGENSRVLKWIFERTDGAGKAEKTAIGYMPTKDALDVAGLDVSETDMTELLKIEKEQWLAEIESIKEHYKTYEQPTKKMPKALFDELSALEERVKSL
jgi:phosphoenolpyruvate carboxykinase (GTP)